MRLAFCFKICALQYTHMRNRLMIFEGRHDAKNPADNDPGPTPGLTPATFDSSDHLTRFKNRYYVHTTIYVA